jgi:nitrogen fixation/metabolism regulation signal transduction histidine kinase
MSPNNKSDDGNIALHELMQPLNIIRLCCGNIRDRIGQKLEEADAEHLASKLGRIEEQVVRMNELLREFHRQSTE